MTVLFILTPLADSVFKSFLDFDISNLISGEPGTWNNFANYIKLFNNTKFLGAIQHTFIFLAFVVVVQLVLGIVLALILDSNIKFGRFIRSIMMTPWVVPTVISALVWMWIFQPQYGLLKYIVSFATGGKVMDFAILNNTNTALLGIGIAALWKQIPLTCLLLLAGLQNVPEEMLEAATIDGANKTRKFFSITLPYIKSVVRVTTALAIIANFKQFPLFWVMTGGGPANSTTTLAILSYREAFVSHNLGSGAAVTTVWILIMILVVTIYNKILGSSEIE
jgi:multiple sugar transport system permease protein